MRLSGMHLHGLHALLELLPVHGGVEAIQVVAHHAAVAAVLVAFERVEGTSLREVYISFLSERTMRQREKREKREKRRTV